MIDPATTQWDLIQKNLLVGPAWLKVIRDNEYEKFKNLGFPKRKLEEWRYTDFKEIQNLDSTVSRNAETSIKKVNDKNQIVFVNGRLNQIGVFEKGLNIRLVTDLKEDEILRWKKASSAISEGRYKDDSLAHLNGAIFSDGVFIECEADVSIKHPILIEYHMNEFQAFTASKSIIVLGAGAQLSVLESFVGSSEKASFSNTVTGVVLGENSKMTYSKVQCESASAFHVSSTFVVAEKNSHLSATLFSVGGKKARSNFIVDFKGEGASVHANGLSITKPQQHLDTFTLIDHSVPRCQSRQLFKNVLSSNSRAVFNGRVIVHPNAQQTDSTQLNKNLLLGKMAEANTRPQLEIFADDVKCTHGATIGQLDPEQLFYLESRGISKTLAIDFLCRGFAEEILYKISNPEIKEVVHKLLLDSFSNLHVELT